MKTKLSILFISLAAVALLCLSSCEKEEEVINTSPIVTCSVCTSVITVVYTGYKTGSEIYETETHKEDGSCIDSDSTYKASVNEYLQDFVDWENEMLHIEQVIVEVDGVLTTNIIQWTETYSFTLDCEN
jgi:hypothetical protein